MAAPRTLYVYRPLLNGEDLIAWAKANGFPTAMLPADLHVTIAYSRTPFDWSGLEPNAGTVRAVLGTRSIQQFGKATVLAFESPDLQARWALLRAAGASWDFPEYQPHVTFTYDPGAVEIDHLAAYPGLLTFGPEVFEEIDDTWSANLEEKQHRSAPLGYGPMTDLFVAPFEVKAAGAPNSGEFEGYGAVFNNVDSHGDVIVAGAFAPGLLALEQSGRKVAMHLNHGLPELGGRRAVGAWHFVAEDTRGLHVKGRVAGMDTEQGRYLHSQIRDGAMTGLSVGYRVRPNGSVLGTKAAAISRHATRVLRDVMVQEISIVDTPSNAESLILQVKAMQSSLDPDRIKAGIGALYELHGRVLAGEGVPSAEDRDQFLSHLQELQAAAGGPPLESGTKSAPTTRRQCEDALRDAGFTRAQAARLAATAFTDLPAQRDAGGGQANEPEAKSASPNAAEFLAMIG